MDLMYPAIKQDGFKKIYARYTRVPQSPSSCLPQQPDERSPRVCSDIPMIVTCRDVGGEEGWGPLRRELLELGITSGGTHVDIEVCHNPSLPWSGPLIHPYI